MTDVCSHRSCASDAAELFYVYVPPQDGEGPIFEGLRANVFYYGACADHMRSALGEMVPLEFTRTRSPDE
jgi:hypothetical protein